MYAASSSTYGDHPALPKVEENIGNPLSPYAVTKYVNELYADVFARSYGFETVGLRYFNVFGKRQDPDGAYAAVIPKWTAAMIKGDDVVINGDGETSRDFCFVANAVQANLLAAMAPQEGRNRCTTSPSAAQHAERPVRLPGAGAGPPGRGLCRSRPEYGEFRAGDVRHSRGRRQQGWPPARLSAHTVLQGLDEAMPWYTQFLR